MRVSSKRIPPLTEADHNVAGLIGTACAFEVPTHPIAAAV